MRLLSHLALGLLVTTSIATACGSDDDKLMRPGRAGAGGEGGEPVGLGGASAQSAGASGAASEPNAGQGGQLVNGAGGAQAGAASVLAGAGGIGGGAGRAGAGGAEATAGAGGAEATAGAGGAEGTAGAGGAAAETVVNLGFDDEPLPSSLDPGTATLTPSQGYADLGPEGDKFGSTFLRGPTGTVITLTLTDLPPHSSLSISMLFAAIDSLDGTGTFPAGDFFKISLDGVDVFRESFANATLDQIQSYDPPAAAILARRVDLGFSGPGSYYTDSAYDFGQDPSLQGLAHSADSATLVFTLEGQGVQDINDESWALDNLRVTVQ